MSLKRSYCICLTIFWVLTSLFVYSQERVIKGKVLSGRDNTPLQGVTVSVRGTKVATVTDENGNYSITVSGNTTGLTFSFVGFETKTASLGISDNLDVVLPAANLIGEEIVVTGYGTTRKKDLTGAVAKLSSKDFQKGQVTAPEQLIAGKIAGVQVTPGDGAPGSAGRVRIRGGSSLNASNAPLVVIDGVPVDNGTISGVANPFTLLNPNDIESFNILKDASASAIYGSRAANGVVLITTKGGQAGKLKINFSSLNSVSIKSGTVDVLNADEFRNLVNNYEGRLANATDKALVGNASTDWQEEIYQPAFTTDNNISLSGGIKGLPYRLSLGYLNQNGILKTDNLQRMSASLNLSPYLFDRHLQIKVNSRYAHTKSHFANQDAIGSAAFFDPTQPIYSGKDAFGGYFEWLNGEAPNLNATRNPLGLLYQMENVGYSDRLIGNVQFDYKLHFLPDLRANLNVGMDKSWGHGTVFVPATAASLYSRGGINNEYKQDRTNKVLEFYLNYVKEISSIQSRFDLTGGYSWQDWVTENPAFPDRRADSSIYEPAGENGYTQNTLVSFYGRLNYSLMDRYLLTVNFRRDGSSRFSPDNRWGNFPSAAFAWRIIEEDFLSRATWLSDLKIRLGWGIIGQQDGIADYGYQPNYFYGDSAAQYQFGNRFIPVIRPQGFDANLKWEETETYNAGIDLGFLNNKITITVDYFIKKTKDLLAEVPVAGGTNFTNILLTNVGSIKNQGLEFTINTNAAAGKDWRIDLGLNFTYIIQNEITKLQLVKDPNYLGADVGNTGFNTIQKHTVGYRPYTFFLYKQVYTENGKPIEGLYEDYNRDGIIGENDKRWFKNPEPNIYGGFSASASYRRLNFGFVLRYSLNNYMFNSLKAGNGIYQTVFPNQGFLINPHRDILNTQFDNRQSWSDYYLENASFLKMDNFYVGYDVGTLKSLGAHLRLTATVQNVFTVTNYTGLDPEIIGGIDNALYPRPRVFALGINLDF